MLWSSHPGLGSVVGEQGFRCSARHTVHTPSGAAAFSGHGGFARVGTRGPSRGVCCWPTATLWVLLVDTTRVPPGLRVLGTKRLAVRCRTRGVRARCAD